MARTWKPELGLLDLDTKFEEGKPIEELDEVQVCVGDTSKELKIGHDLQPSIQSEIVNFLMQNLDVFAWDHEYMK